MHIQFYSSKQHSRFQHDDSLLQSSSISANRKCDSYSIPFVVSKLNKTKRLQNSEFVYSLFDLIHYVPSTIFQLNRDGSSWVEPVLSYDKCVLLKDHNAVTPVRLEPAAPRSRVKHSTTKPLRSQNSEFNTQWGITRRCIKANRKNCLLKSKV